MMPDATDATDAPDQPMVTAVPRPVFRELTVCEAPGVSRRPTPAQQQQAAKDIQQPQEIALPPCLAAYGDRTNLLFLAELLQNPAPKNISQLEQPYVGLYGLELDSESEYARRYKQVLSFDKDGQLIRVEGVNGKTIVRNDNGALVHHDHESGMVEKLVYTVTHAYRYIKFPNKYPKRDWELSDVYRWRDRDCELVTDLNYLRFDALGRVVERARVHDGEAQEPRSTFTYEGGALVRRVDNACGEITHYAINDMVKDSQRKREFINQATGELVDFNQTWQLHAPQE